jgi:hypothetical protein
MLCLCSQLGAGQQAAAVVEQGLQAVCAVAALHLGHKNHMVALFMSAAVAALEACQAALEQWHASRAPAVREADPALLARPGKALGQRQLVRAQDMDGVVGYA